MQTNALTRVAAVLVGAEGLGILALVIWQLTALGSGDTGSVPSAVALLVLTAAGGLAVLAFSAALWRGQSWGRSGAIVTQLLILAVALGAATGAYAEPLTAFAIAVPALIALVLLVLSARQRPSDDDGSGAAASDRSSR